MLRIFLATFFCMALWIQPDLGSASDQSMVRLVKKASELNIRRLKYFEGGIYGKLGETLYYITTRDKAPDLDTLYPLMMKVLSKTYGCFLRQRIKTDEMYQFICRDTRRITMRPLFGDKVVLFHSTQTDRFGRPIYVNGTGTSSLSH